MPLPTRFEITNAVRYPQFIKDDFLTGYSVALKPNGKVQEWGGGFSMVYSMINNENKWALKVWHREINDNRGRYTKILNHLEKCNLPYFSECAYVQNGLLVNDEPCDTLRIKWIDGIRITEYISLNLSKPDVLEQLSKDFLKMINDLHDNNISHGDLQHDNIFITPAGEIKLIDYDSLCVPEIDGERDVCVGRYGFQHPSRITSGTIASLKIDYFSELIIYLSIKAVAENYLLWDKYKVVAADDRLLFTPENFTQWVDSPLRNDLNLLSQEIQNLVKVLESYLASHLFLSPFTSYKE